MLGALANHSVSIEEGSIYLRTGVGALTEKAQVLEIMQDRMGIPHVRFRLQVTRGTANPSIENRTLSLEAFYARYKKLS